MRSEEHRRFPVEFDIPHAHSPWPRKVVQMSNSMRLYHLFGLISQHRANRPPPATDRTGMLVTGRYDPHVKQKALTSGRKKYSPRFMT